VRADGKKARANCRDTLSSCRTAPLKPKDGLNVPPAVYCTGIGISIRLRKCWGCRWCLRECGRVSRLIKMQPQSSLVLALVEVCLLRIPKDTELLLRLFHSVLIRCRPLRVL
jgi:hypothetical protein